MAQPATIQVQYVNQPKPGKRAGSVRDTNGQYWTVAPEHLGYFAENQMAEILYDDHGNYQMVVGLGGQLFPKTPRPPQPGAGTPQTPAQPQTAGPPRNATWPTPPAQELTRVPDKRHDTPEEIFITGIVGRAMGSGKFDIVQIPELTRVARWAWQTRHSPGVTEMETQHVAGSPAHQARSDIDSQYGVQHPNMTDIPGDPGPFPGDVQ